MSSPNLETVRQYYRKRAADYDEQEDKARYFNLELHGFYRLLETAPPHIREIYSLGEGSMMLHYGLLTGVKV